MIRVMVAALCLLIASPLMAQEASDESDQAVILVVGAGGTEEYAESFQLWADQWRQVSSHTKLTVIGVDEQKKQSKTQLQQAISESAKDDQFNEVWLVMIGHGTFDGKRAKFNLNGPDIEASELKSMLSQIEKRTVILNCSSCSSPFVNLLSGKNRVIVSATRNGYESNFARFGRYLSNAIDDPAIDLDKDGQTSLLEAFCTASRKSNEFYQAENRIVTEHALLDDNGDKKGTPADWFDGVRATKTPKSGVADGLLANQVFLNRRGVDRLLSAEDRELRDQLEAQLEQLRSMKGKMDQTTYLATIEPVLIQIAKLYDQTDVDTETE